MKLPAKIKHGIIKITNLSLFLHFFFSHYCWRHLQVEPLKNNKGLPNLPLKRFWIIREWDIRLFRMMKLFLMLLQKKNWYAIKKRQMKKKKEKNKDPHVISFYTVVSMWPFTTDMVLYVSECQLENLNWLVLLLTYMLQYSFPDELIIPNRYEPWLY